MGSWLRRLAPRSILDRAGERQREDDEKIRALSEALGPKYADPVDVRRIGNDVDKAIRAALVQGYRFGRSGPIRPDRLRNADGVRASGINHAVEDSDADASLGLLTGQLARMEVVAEDALVSRHRGFRHGSPAVVDFPLPAQASLVGNAPDMHITLRRVSG